MWQKFMALWRRGRESAVLYGAAGTIVRVGANVLLLPVVLRRLSESELAFWWVFLALGGVANLVDFGFAQSISRVYSYLWAGADDFDTEGLRAPSGNHEPNQARLRKFNTTVRYLYWRLALGATALLAVGGTLFLIGSGKTAGNVSGIWICWAAYVFTVGYSLGTTHWFAACQGINRVREMQASNLWGGLTYLIVAATLLVMGWGLFAMVIATGLRGWVARFWCHRAYRKAVPEVVGEELQPDLTMLKKLWPNARKFGVLSMGVYLIYTANVLISSHFLGDSVTASFGLTAQVGTFLVSFSSIWLTVKWPQITILRTQGRTNEMAVIFAHRLGWSIGTFVLGSMSLVFLGNRILGWMGTHTRLLPETYLSVYLVYLGQQMIYAQFGSLKFTENVVPFFKLSLFTGLGLLALSALMAWQIGLWGLILAPLIVTVATCAWYVTWQGFRCQPLNLRQFFHAAIYGRP